MSAHRLKDRLRRLTSTRQDHSKTSTVTSSLPGWERLRATEKRTESGSFILRKNYFPSSLQHGHYRLDSLREYAERLTPLCAPSPETPLHCERLLFFDAETTGLGVGAGNVPFLIGIGYFKAEVFVVEQLFMRNPAEEKAMLEYVLAIMEERDVLVTYNGRAFDWPVMKNRQVLNRIASVLKPGDTEPIHLDFLYAARSLWKNTLESCRLSIIERERLGVERIDDVPGAMAPSLYFRFLREEDPALMRGVFEHNERDVLSLVALAICLGRLLSGEYDSKQLEAEELFRLGNWLERLGETEKAEKVFSRLIARDDAGMERYWMPLALKYKREGKWDQALALWKRSAARRGTFSSGAVNALIELAKYYEHQQKDFETALTHALEAKARWEARPLFREHGEEYRKRMMEMEHRIARLRRKVRLKSSSGSKRIHANTKRTHKPLQQQWDMFVAETLFNGWQEEGNG